MCKALPLLLEGISDFCTDQPTLHRLSCVAFPWPMSWSLFPKLVLGSFFTMSLSDLASLFHCMESLFLVPLFLPLSHVGIPSGFDIFTWPAFASKGWQTVFLQSRGTACPDIITRVPIYSPKCPSLDDKLQMTFLGSAFPGWGGGRSLCSHVLHT